MDLDQDPRGCSTSHCRLESAHLPRLCRQSTAAATKLGGILASTRCRESAPPEAIAALVFG